MQTNQEAMSALERRIDMSVAIADIDKDVDNRLKKLSHTVKMPGFRPGKVPFKVVARTYEPQARSEAIGAAVEKAFSEAVRAQSLRVAGYPRIEPKETSVAGTLEFSAVFEVYPAVTVGDLSSREIERPVLEISETEVDKTLEVLRKQHTRYDVADRPAAVGDRLVIDFTGKKDGEVFDGGQAWDFPVVLGAGAMLKDFENAVTGLGAGESKTFDLTFPEDYHSKTLAGQQVQFEVTVKKVEIPLIPEIDADFAKTLGIADGDIAKLRVEVKDNLKREVRRRIRAKIKEHVMTLILEATPLEVPKALVDAESEQLAENARHDLERRGVSAKNIPVEQSWFTEQATRRVKLGLIMAELVKAHDLRAKPEQVKAIIEDMAQSYEVPSELIRWYYAKPERLTPIEAAAIEDNVVEWACAQAKTNDKPTTFDELMGNTAAA
jgi:trigger factor